MSDEGEGHITAQRAVAYIIKIVIAPHVGNCTMKMDRVPTAPLKKFTITERLANCSHYGLL